MGDAVKYIKYQPSIEADGAKTEAGDCAAEHEDKSCLVPDGGAIQGDESLCKCYHKYSAIENCRKFDSYWFHTGRQEKEERYGRGERK